MTKKDYELIAEAIRFELHMWRNNAGPVYGMEAIEAIRGLAERTASTLTTRDNNFKRDLFLKDCGVYRETTDDPFGDNRPVYQD